MENITETDYDIFIKKFFHLADFYILSDGTSNQINISGSSLKNFKPVYDNIKQYMEGDKINIEESKIFLYKFSNIFNLLANLMKGELFLDSVK
jgi:hypothetical protein